MVSETHKAIVNGLWRKLSTVEIIDELKNPRGLNLILNDASERSLELLINQLRTRVDEAWACVEEAALNAAREGFSREEVHAYLSKPHLLPQGVIDHHVFKAFEKIAAEK